VLDVIGVIRVFQGDTHMTGWIAASAATAMLGAATIGPGTNEQRGNAWVIEPPSVEWVQSFELADAWTPELEQAVRVFSGSTSRIGVTIRDLSDEELKGGKGTMGVKIDEVETDSPAAKAGFKNGDIVVEFDGERVRSTRQFTRLVQETAPGRSVQAAVQRDGQRVTLNVQPRDGGSVGYFDRLDLLSPRKVPAPAVKSVDILPKMFALTGAGRLGIMVDELSTQLAEYFGTKDGVLVTTVNDNSAASKAGVRAGDVITSINGGAVNSAADLRRRAQSLEDGDEFTLNVVRDKKTMTLKGKIDLQSPRRPTGRTIL
jgi:serine protease Do